MEQNNIDKPAIREVKLKRSRIEVGRLYDSMKKTYSPMTFADVKRQTDIKTSN